MWSDTHHNHKNILRYSSRPFPNVEEMNNALYAGLDFLPKDGVLFDLGDFSFGGYQVVETSFLKYVNRLKELGVMQLFYCRGNHDSKIDDLLIKHNLEDFVTISDYFEVSCGKQNFVMFHYPIESWNGKSHGSYHLFGHEHKNLESEHGQNKLHVGVDTIGYAPISLEKVMQIINKRNKC